MVRDAVPLLLPLSQGRLSAHLALVLPLQPLQHRHRLSPHLRQTWPPAVRVVCDSIQSKVVPELSALQQTNQTEIFSSATTSFNFLYKVYHKTGRTSLSSSSQSPFLFLDLIIHLLILLVNIGVLLSSPGLVLAVLKVVWRHWHGVSTINPRTSPGSVSPGSCLPWLLSSVTSPLTSGCWKRFSV